MFILTLLLVVAALGVSAPAQADIGWLAPTTLSEVNRDARQPQVAVDAGGNALAVWESFDGASWRIQAASRAAGESFGAPQKLSAFGQHAFEPQVAFDQQGNALVVWYRFDGANFRIQAAFRPAGGSFGSAVTISGPGGDARRPQVRFDRQGNALVVWDRFDGTTTRVEAAFRSAGGSFGSPQVLTAPGPEAFKPQIAIDPQGNALVAWERHEGIYYRIQAAFRPAGGSFGPPQTLSAPGQHATSAQLAMDEQGNALAVWHRSDGTNDRVQAAFRPAGGSFGTAQNISPAGRSAIYPQVAFDRQGNALAVWAGSDGANFRIQASFRPAADVGFGAVQTLSEPGHEASRVQVAVDSRGNAYAIWRTLDNPVESDESHVEVVFRSAGDSFGPPRSISQPGGRVHDPQIAVDEHGNAVAVWDRLAPNATTNQVEAALSTRRCSTPDCQN